MSHWFRQSLLGSERIGLMIKIASIKTRLYIKSQARWLHYLWLYLRVPKTPGPPIKAIFFLACRVKISILKWDSLPTSRVKIRRVSYQANLGVWFKRKKRGRMRISLTRQLIAERDKRNGRFCHSAFLNSRVKCRTLRFHLWGALMKMQSILRFSSLINFRNLNWERRLMMDWRLMRTWKKMQGYFFISNRIPCRQLALLGRIRSTPLTTERFIH